MFARNFDFDLDVDADKVSYNLGIEIEAHRAQNDEDLWGVLLDARVNWTSKDDEDSFTAPFELQLKLMAVYAWLGEGLDDSEIEDWLVYNSEHLLWPYLRVYIQQITAASDIPPLTIYTLGVPRSLAESEAQPEPEPESAVEQHSSAG